MVRRCYLKSSLVIFLKNARGLFPGKWPVRDTAYKYTSLEMWTTFIITIHNLQVSFSETKLFRSVPSAQE